MKKLLLCALFSLPFVARAATPTQDVNLSVSLLPDTQYEVTADVTVNSVSSLLGLLGLDGNQSPLQILDSSGNVLGEVPAENLAGLLDGLTGTVTQHISTMVQTTDSVVGGITARVLNDPSVLISHIEVRGIPAVLYGPIVQVAHSRRVGNSLRLRGTASEKGGPVAMVQIMAHGRVHRAQGTSAWSSRLALTKGVNQIVVQSVGRSGLVSAPLHMKVRNP